MPDFVFYPGDRVVVVPRVIIDPIGLAGPAVGAFAGCHGTIDEVRDGHLMIYMDASGRPKRALRFSFDEVQVVAETVIGPFS